MKKIFLFFIFTFIICGCTSTIIEKPRKTQGIYAPYIKNGEILVGFMITSNEPDRNISDISEKELIAKKLRIPRELILDDKEQILYFYDERAVQGKNKIFIIYNFESYEKMTNDFYKKFIKEDGYSDIRKYNDEAVTLGEIIWNLQDKKLHIIANENENYYVMDALHYVKLKYCRENYFDEKIRDMELDIISVNSPLFLEKHLEGYTKSKVRYYTNENGKLYEGKEVTASENVGYGTKILMYGVTKGLEIMSLPKAGLKRLLGAEN